MRRAALDDAAKVGNGLTPEEVQLENKLRVERNGNGQDINLRARTSTLRRSSVLKGLGKQANDATSLASSVAVDNTLSTSIGSSVLDRLEGVDADITQDYTLLGQATTVRARPSAACPLVPSARAGRRCLAGASAADTATAAQFLGPVLRAAARPAVISAGHRHSIFR